MTPLARLLAAVKAGESLEWGDFVTGLNLGLKIVGFDGPASLHPAHWKARDSASLALWANQGSTDAAEALCEAMLPGVCWRLEQNHGDGCMASLALLPVAIKGFADTPGCALLIAMLRALVAKEDVA